jgi:sugar/nucleoside kinase (ribokinase family)
MNSIDYLIIGHITQDLTPAGPCLGGTPSYAAQTARAFCLRVGIVTSARQGEPLLHAPELQDVAVVCVPAAETTTFTNVYQDGGRRQILSGRAASLDTDDVPDAWRDTPVVHLGPMAVELLPALASHFPGAFLGITPQGWLRCWDAQGVVSRAAWPDAETVLPHATAVVISPEDVQFDQAQIGHYARLSRLLAVTQAGEGADIHAGGQVHHVPTRAIDERDPTGAGDIFAAVFFVWLAQHPGDPIGAARLANYIATTSVTRSGLASAPTSDEVEAAKAALGLGG